jgi:type VI secretion system protein ImpH
MTVSAERRAQSAEDPKYVPPRPSPAAKLERTLREDPTGFQFYQAVRLLGRLRPTRAPVGEWADPADEIARFAVTTSLAFPASEIHALTLPPADPSTAAALAETGTFAVQTTGLHATSAQALAEAKAGQTRITVNFFGLTGPQGVLPQVYSEYAGLRARAKDTALRDFLDLFNHRALSLLYRAWERNKFTIAAEAGHEDRLLAHLLDLVGLGTPAQRQRLPVRDEALAFYAGLLSVRTRPADGLARLVGDYFDVATSVEQFVGEWRRVDETGQCTLGGDGAAGRLGLGVLGDVAWDPQARVRLRLGPLTRAEFDAFLPGGAQHLALRSLARLYADEQVGVDAQLVLARAAVPPCVLGAATPPPAAARPAGGAHAPAPLGRGTWLATRTPARDPDDAVLRLC